MKSKIRDLINEKILIFDGAMGTEIQKKNLQPADFGEEKFVGCNEYLILSKPRVILDIHKSYLEAGADIIETNTFGATPLVLKEYGLEDQAEFINFTSASLARDLADTYSTPLKPRFVAGSMGPTNKSLFLSDDISFDELADNFYLQAKALIKGGVDYLLLETMMDTLNIKAGIKGIKKAFQELELELPIAISITLEKNGALLTGQSIASCYEALEHINPLYFGLNCATGPDLMAPFLEELVRVANCPIAVAPNAGLPDENGKYPEDPKDFIKVINSFLTKGWVNVVGGCCGTTPRYISSISSRVEGTESLHKQYFIPGGLRGLAPLKIVGERANVIGSKAFRTLINEEKFEEAVEIAKNQVAKGADIIDVCLTNPDRNEVEDLATFLKLAVKVIKVPYMIDTQNPKALLVALKLIPSKIILNSVNLEKGEDLFAEMLPLIKQFGGAVVVGLIKDQPAIKAERKLEIARISYDLITKKYQIPAKDIIFDPLVFPITANDETYYLSAKETLETIKLLKGEFPEAKTILGISNLSFGLPLNAREVLNQVFLDLAVENGLDYAIVNAEKVNRIPGGLCPPGIHELILDNSPENIQKFIDFFRGEKVTAKKQETNQSFEEQLIQKIVEGSKTKLETILAELIKEKSPLDIINQVLLKAMGIVGEKFQKNELIITEVLKSAEVMQSAVNYLEPLLPKERQKRGKFLLATVKGDVHDIGKNLVALLFRSNGYEIIDLGINCDKETIIKECIKHQPNFIGLSGLLVKSTLEMVECAKELTKNRISVPLLLGGAALSKKFVTEKVQPEYNGQVFYSSDALAGLFFALESSQ